MNAIRKNIPNFITCLNLFSGCLAVKMAVEGKFFESFWLIIFAGIFDFLDGFAARLLKAQSPIGAQLDSLADVVSFGLAPGMMVWSLLNKLLLLGGLTGFYSIAVYSAFLIPVFSALRLAKFNIDTRQTSSFIGLPVPANALFWAGAVNVIFVYPLFVPPFLMIIDFLLIIVIFCWLMVSDLPMFSLKFKNFSLRDNIFQYFLIVATIVLALTVGFGGISLSIALYIILSVIKNKIS